MAKLETPIKCMVEATVIPCIIDDLKDLINEYGYYIPYYGLEEVIDKYGDMLKVQDNDK